MLVPIVGFSFHSGSVTKHLGCYFINSLSSILELSLGRPLLISLLPCNKNRPRHNSFRPDQLVDVGGVLTVVGAELSQGK